MAKEFSAGMVVYNKKLKKYLVLEYESHWGFVKGGIEKGEEEEATAKRELGEETGIKKFEIVKGFKEKLSYFYKKEGETVYKEVSFFLIITEVEKVKLSKEHKSFRWLGYEEAWEKIKFKNTREVLEKANEYIMKKL
jgi:bis(5'-nucleosidyl)-tetraphosphatase